MFDDNSSALGLDQLSNSELLTGTRRLVGCGNQLLAALLAHLGEVEARGIHRERSCASLYTYCIYELRMSEDSALRRAKAARVVREFPALLGAVARGELHLTGLLLLGPHLTESNQVEVLALAKHRTKKEIEQLVRRLDPLPDVPPRIEPLGPAPSGFPRMSSWKAMTTAFAGPVRELPPGERPSDWVSETLMNPEPAMNPDPDSSPFELPAPGHHEKSPRLDVAERYSVQFTATQEYVDLLDEARDLLSHAAPNAALNEVHQRALECLVKELRKKKYAETEQPRETGREAPGEPRSSSRYIPAAVRRRVAERDIRRCTYVDDRGQRCCETRLLEFHHLDAHANGGERTEDNLTMRCRAHNTLAAEQDFGRDFIREKQGRADPRQRGSSDQTGCHPRQRGSSNQTGCQPRQRGDSDQTGCHPRQRGDYGRPSSLEIR